MNPLSINNTGFSFQDILLSSVRSIARHAHLVQYQMHMWSCSTMYISYSTTCTSRTSFLYDLLSVRFITSIPEVLVEFNLMIIYFDIPILFSTFATMIDWNLIFSQIATVAFDIVYFGAIIGTIIVVILDNRTR